MTTNFNPNKIRYKAFFYVVIFLSHVEFVGHGCSLPLIICGEELRAVKVGPNIYTQLGVDGILKIEVVSLLMFTIIISP